MFIIKKNPSQANVPRNIRFTEDVFDELNRTAAEHGISFNSLVLQCCRYALDELSTDKKASDED